MKADVLLKWFDGHRRELPWRENRDPYAIWVSEVMLQQTTVAAVVPFFQRFMAAFPTVADLAKADEAEVLKHWQGLGYYRRARHLHEAAKQLVADHKGQIPNDADVVGELPGIGPYMLGAVLSQAFDARLPIVEANSQRVLCRWFGKKVDPRAGAGKAWVWEAAASLLPEKNVGDYNQALMELGSLICTPTNPSCGKCPVKQWCKAYEQGEQEEIPLKPAAKVITEVREVAVVVRRGPRLLFCRRPESGRWARMWEFPHGEVQEGEELEAAAERIASELLGLKVTVGDEVLTLKHAVTRYQVTLTGFEAASAAGEPKSEFFTECQWLLPEELSQHPTSSPQKKLVQAMQKPGRALRLF